MMRTTRHELSFSNVAYTIGADFTEQCADFPRMGDLATGIIRTLRRTKFRGLR